MDYLAPRIICFGCSFTKYKWPTYADILESDNKGWAGCGNERIFYLILEQYKRDKFQNFDLVIVQWTSPYRFDYLSSSGWIGNGLITDQDNIYNKLKSWYNEDYEIEKTNNYKLAVDNLLKSTRVDYHILDINTMKKGNYTFVTGCTWKMPYTDNHPTVAQHIGLAKDIAKSYNVSIDQNIINKGYGLHEQIVRTKHFDQYML
tara:strand:+ start:1857 stop:2465 length:609 start_codon:yes stop_codon:yes gene_type:complete